MNLGHALGIRIRVSPYFLAVVLLTAIAGGTRTLTVYFFLIITHELAHVVFATGLGIRVEEVELMPFGSVARIPELWHAVPAAETSIALAGPMHNFLLLAIGLVVQWSGAAVSAELVQLFIEANLVLGLFNILPVLPLDGGRVMRAQLAPRIGYAQATTVLARAGRLLAVAILLAAVALLWTSATVAPTLFVIGLFVYYAAARERADLRLSPLYRVLERHKRMDHGRAVPVQNIAVAHDSTVGDVLQQLSGDHYYVIWVADEHRVLGYLPETELAILVEQVSMETTMGDLLDII